MELAWLVRQSDGWNDDDKFRWTLEHGASLYTYLQTHTAGDVAELLRRIKEGRIDMAANHSTPMTENCSYEVLTRLFYHPQPLLVDLLGIARERRSCSTTWSGSPGRWRWPPREAGIPYANFGRNDMSNGFQPAGNNPFHWLAADGDATHKLPRRGGALCAAGLRGEGPPVDRVREKQADYPYAAALLPDSNDFNAASMRSRMS